MAAATASSSSGSTGRKYDVFLNFRGEDTRKIFVSHLYRALNQKAINTFIDMEELRKGNDLSELLETIRHSRLSIVVLSENYASSTWCLRELVEILQCMDTKKQMVVAIFYQVDPSDVRKLKRSFAEAFSTHEHDWNTETEEVQRWRSALTRVTNLSGWDSRHYEDDAKLITEIVEDVFKKLVHTSSIKSNGLVGMTSHLHEMSLRLCAGVDDVRVVGIWGMGGLGKTTIARTVYDKIACQFEADCFLENVKEGFSKHGAVHMLEELLSRILKEKVRSLGTLDRGSKMIMERLGTRKVFLVLDDVDNIAQIETLLGVKSSHHSFGSGSRIIITTRDKQLLCGADAIYRPKNLSDYEAHELFRLYAFRTKQPTGDYGHLSRRSVKYAQGLPLALKVLGAFLHNKSIPEWEAVLGKIKKSPLKDIQDVLRISFDGLDDSEKNIFLDIACFFRGIMTKDYATKFLDSCGFFPHSGLRVLVDRALLTITDNGDVLEMHDLLQEMGREVVRQESIKEPGRRSRLWSHEDINHVLSQTTGTEAVEGIFLKLTNSNEVCLNVEAFVGMTKLRILMIGYDGDVIGSDSKYVCPFQWRFSSDLSRFRQNVIGDFKFISHELRFLLWRGCPMKSLPLNFRPKNLIELDMCYSEIEYLWEGTKPLEMLEIIKLRRCMSLKKIPDFSKATNLKKLILDGCVSLVEVHPSISTLKNLVLLILSGCKELKVFPSSISMKSLKALDLSNCSNFEKFPENLEAMEELSHLCLDGTAIQELPLSFNNLTGLVTLSLQDCRVLKSLPSTIGMKSLETFCLLGCSKLETFPEISEVMEKLPSLRLVGTAIEELPLSIKNLKGLVTLDLSDCKELKSLPSSICQLKCLECVILSGCIEFEVFPNIDENMERLRELHLDGTSIRELFPSIERLRGLVYLNMRDCKSLVHLPDNICNLPFLSGLNLCGCLNLSKLPENYLEDFEFMWDVAVEFENT